MDIPSIILSLLLTAVAYLAFPLIRLLINGGRFAENRAHKIALWNSVVFGAAFCIITIAVSEDGILWNGAPAILYYWINRWILTDKNATEDTVSEDPIYHSQNGEDIGKASNPRAPVVDVVDFPSANENKKFTSPDKPKKKQAKKKAIIIIISILAVALIVGIISIVISMSGNSTGGRPDTVYNVAVRTISLGDEFTAEFVLSTWKNGEATEQSMIQIMNEYGSEQGGGKLYVITRGEFVDEIDEWCFYDKRKVGDYAIIKNAYGYSICYISGFNKEKSDIETTPSYKDLGVTLEQYNISPKQEKALQSTI